MSKYLLIYSSENEAVAQQIASSIGVSIDLSKLDKEANPLVKAAEYTYKMLLLTDDLLKSEKAMVWAYSLLQNNLNASFIPIVAKGNTQPTSFERITNVIQYMNYWQERYLDVRKREHSPDHPEVARIRTISQEIGELLRLVRESQYYQLDEFQSNNYDIFYRVTDTSKGHFDTASTTVYPLQETAVVAPVLEEKIVAEIVEIPQQIVPEIVEIPTEIHIDIPQAIDEVPELISEPIILSPTIETKISDDNDAKDTFFEIVDTTQSTDNQLIESIIETPKQEQQVSVADLIAQSNDDDDDELDNIIGGMSIPGLNLLDRKPHVTTVPEPQSVEHFELPTSEIEEDDFFDKILENDKQNKSLNAVVEEVVGEEDNEGDDENDTKLDVTKSNLEAMLFGDDDDDDDDEINDILHKAEEEFAGSAPFSDSVIPDLEKGGIFQEAIAQTNKGIVSAEIDSDSETEIETKIIADNIEPITALTVDENEVEITEKDTIITTETDAEIASEIVVETPVSDDSQIAGAVDFQAAIKLLNDGKVNESFKIIEQLCIQYPDNQHFRFKKAFILSKYHHDIKGAINELETILSANEHNDEANHLLAEIAEINHDYVTAARYYEKVAADNPFYPNIHYKLGLFFLTYFPEKTDKAAFHFDEAKTYSPKNPDVYYQFAILQHEQLGESEKAVENLEKTLELAPNHPFAHYDLALIYFELGDRYTALGHYEQSCILNPEFKTTANDEAFAIPKIVSMDRALEAINLHEDRNKVTEADDDDDINIEDYTADVTENTDIQHIMNIENQQESEQAIHETTAIEVDDSLTLGVAAISTGLDLPDDQPFPIIGEAEINSENEVLDVQQNEVSETIETENLLKTEAEKEIEKPSESHTEVIESGIANLKIYAPKSDRKTVLITGATSGIGKETAAIFAENGYNLILCGRRAGRLDLEQRLLNELYGVSVEVLSFDIQSYSECEAAINSLSDEWRNIDILVNNAGLARGFDPIHTINIADMEAMIDTNLKGLLYMTRLVTPNMVARKSGHVINICSTAGKEAYPNGNVYSATKFAVDSLTKSMRMDLHTHGIRVSQVAPGAVEENEFSVVRFGGDAERAKKVYDGFQALRSEDIARTIYYIASQPAHVNIQDVLILSTQQAAATMIDRSGKDKYN